MNNFFIRIVITTAGTHAGICNTARVSESGVLLLPWNGFTTTERSKTVIAA